MAGNFVGTMLKYRSFLKTTTFRKFQFNKMSGTSDRIIVEMNKETGKQKLFKIFIDVA